MTAPLPPEIIIIYQHRGKDPFTASELHAHSAAKHHTIWYINHKYIRKIKDSNPATYILTEKTVAACSISPEDLRRLKDSGASISELSRITHTSCHTVEKRLQQD